MVKYSKLLDSLCLLTLVPLGFTFGGIVNGATVVTSTPMNASLLQYSDLQYLGAFRLPSGGSGNATFKYSDEGFAYNSANNSLLIKGHVYGQMVSEVNIPVFKMGNVSDLNVATTLQSFSDITENNLNQQNISNGMRLGGLLVYNNKLIGAEFAYYDGSGKQDRSHFSSGLDLSAPGDYKGMYRVGSVFPAFVGGYMTTIPPEWRQAFGGPVLTGHCCTSIISHQSWGPAAFVFDPDLLGVQNPVPAIPIVYYDSSHPTLGQWGGGGPANPIYNMSTLITGIIFPPGMRSVLFFGRTGMGIPCYGEGSACGDPADSSKGTHAYPYSSYYWAYDVIDLLSVKNGTKQPWEILPYAHGPMTLPYGEGENNLNGVAYDEANRILYIAQDHVDGAKPIIHAYKVNVTGGTLTPTPPPTPTLSPSPAPTPVSTPIPQLTPTLTPTPSTPIPIPSSSAKFIIGDRIKTIARISVRKNAGGLRIGIQGMGSSGRVVGGPARALNKNWWKINYDTGADGWSVEDYLIKKIFSVPLTPTPQPMSSPNPTPINSMGVLGHAAVGSAKDISDSNSLQGVKNLSAKTNAYKNSSIAAEVYSSVQDSLNILFKKIETMRNFLLGL